MSLAGYQATAQRIVVYVRAGKPREAASLLAQYQAEPYAAAYVAMWAYALLGDGTTEAIQWQRAVGALLTRGDV